MSEIKDEKLGDALDALGAKFVIRKMPRYDPNTYSPQAIEFASMPYNQEVQKNMDLRPNQYVGEPMRWSEAQALIKLLKGTENGAQ